MRGAAIVAVFLFQTLAISQTRTGVLSGQLLSSDGVPMAAVRVAAVDASDVAAMISLAQTDRDGRYRLENVPPGNYFIQAGPIGVQSYYPGVGSIAKAKTISVTAGMTVGALDFKFVPSSGIVRSTRTPSAVSSTKFSGIVRDMADRPLPNMTIVLSSDHDEAPFLTTTNADGTFQFSDLAAGVYSVEVLSPVQSGYRSAGYEQLKSAITIGNAENLNQEIRLRLVMDSAWQRQPEMFARPVPRTPMGGIAEPQLWSAITKYVPPVYPANAAARKLKEALSIQVRLTKDGTLVWARLISPNVDPDLARAAVESIAQWRFKPVIRNDSRDIQGTITINFPPD